MSGQHPTPRTTPPGFIGQFGVAQRLGVSTAAVVAMTLAGTLPKPRRRGSSGRKIWAVEEIDRIAEEITAGRTSRPATHAPVLEEFSK